jgi:hypothetical protein
MLSPSVSALRARIGRKHVDIGAPLLEAGFARRRAHGLRIEPLRPARQRGGADATVRCGERLARWAMPYRVLILAPLTDVPARVEAELQDRLREIADSLDGLPPEASLSKSLMSEGLLIDVEGWRFGYRVDQANRTLLVERVVFKGQG